MTLYRRSGSPYWFYDVSSADGLTRIRKSTKVRHDAPTKELQKQNQAAARILEHQAYATLATQRATGQVTRPSITFKAFAFWYLEHVISRQEGKERTAYRVGLFVKTFGSKQLAAISKDDVQEWVTARLRTVSPLTVWTDISHLKPLFKAAVPKYLERSPLEGFTVAKGTPKERHILRPEDEAKLYAVLTPRDRLLVLAALHTLLRLGDLLRLTWGDDRGTHFVIQRTKNKRPTQILISQPLRHALDAFRGPASNLQPIFRARGKATAIDRKYAGLMFQKACQQAGVPYGVQPRGITFHSLRHTGATRFLEAGGSLRELQQHGNWKSLQHLTTYTHPDDHAIRQTLRKLTVPSRVPEMSRTHSARLRKQHISRHQNHADSPSKHAK